MSSSSLTKFVYFVMLSCAHTIDADGEYRLLAVLTLAPTRPKIANKIARKFIVGRK